MLVLSRKIGETITIGTEVTIRVIRVSGNQVRLGIEAPDWVKVMRSELQVPLDTPFAEAHPLHQQETHCAPRQKSR